MKMFTLLFTGDVVESAAPVEGAAPVENAAAQTVTETNPTEPGSADAETKPQQQGSSWSMWIMLALIFVVMWFFMIRPQKKQQKELQKFRDSLKKGDKIVTIGGIYGTVVEVKDATVLVEVDNGVKMRFSKQALVKDFSDPQQ